MKVSPGFARALRWVFTVVLVMAALGAVVEFTERAPAGSAFRTALAVVAMLGRLAMVGVLLYLLWTVTTRPHAAPNASSPRQPPRTDSLP